jgi:hypothetical protein
MRKLNIFCLPGKFNLDFYQGALPEVYVYLHYVDTRHQSRVVIHNGGNTNKVNLEKILKLQKRADFKTLFQKLE